jgi:hypothetical protein
VITDVALGAVLIGLLVGLLLLRRYLGTESFRRSDLRRASFGLLMAIGPFFGVHPKPPEPEPPAVLTPKGEDGDDPLDAMGVELHDQRDTHDKHDERDDGGDTR